MKVGAERMRGALVDGGNQRIVARVVMHGDWFCTASGRGSGRWPRHRPTVGWRFSQRRFHLELFYYTMQRSHGGHWPGMVYTAAVGNSSPFLDSLHFEHFDKRVNHESTLKYLSKCSKWRLSKKRGPVADGWVHRILIYV